MSISDALRFRELEATLAELLARIEAIEARQGAETAAGAAGGRDRNSPAHASALTGDAAMAGGHLLGKHGGHRRSEAAKGQGANVTSTERGNRASYALARLGRDRPDLAEKVLAGELSAHAAAIAAGFRKRMISVPADADDARRSGGSR